MRQTICMTILLSTLIFRAPVETAQTRGAAPRPPAAGASVNAPVTPGPPLSVAEVIEGLYSLGSSTRVEELITRRGVKFKGDPITMEILKEFGLSDRVLKLIPPPPEAPQPVFAGALTILCQPADCLVVVNDKFYGSTRQGRTVVNGLPVGDAVVQVFSDRYESRLQKFSLPDQKPVEAKFVLEVKPEVHQHLGKESLLEAIRAIGGLDGVSYLGEFGGDGTLDWVDSKGETQRWPMTFTKQPGKDIVTMVFKTRDGECSVSIQGGASKQQCKGKLKNSGEGTADQAAKLFLRYQIANVLQQLLERIPGLSTSPDDKSLESSNNYDSYLMTLDKDKLPVEVVYRLTDKADSTFRVQYSNYTNLAVGRYPGQMAIALENRDPGWVFTLKSVQTRAIRP